MPENLALAIIVNRIAELAPDLRADLAYAIENCIDEDDGYPKERLAALYELLTGIGHSSTRRLRRSRREVG